MESRHGHDLHRCPERQGGRMGGPRTIAAGVDERSIGGLYRWRTAAVRAGADVATGRRQLLRHTHAIAMGNGHCATPIHDLGVPIRIDPGTSACMESPWPGSIGLDVKGGTPKRTHPSMADQIVAFPRSHYGERRRRPVLRARRSRAAWRGRRAPATSAKSPATPTTYGELPWP